MARNSSGTHSLPAASNPVTTGTTITSTWANTTMADLSAEITDSLSRSGKGPMQAPLEATDGTAAAPSITFDSDVDTGLYRVGANEGGVAAAGARVAGWSATGWLANVVQAVTATSQTIKGAIADGASAVAHIIDNTIALTTSGAKIVSFRTNGVEKAYIDKDGNYVAGNAAVSVTVGTDWAAAAINAYKSGAGVASLHIVASSATVGSASFNTIVTMPAGALPYKACRAMGRFDDASAGQSYAALFEMTAAGVVSLALYDNGSVLTSPPAIGAGDTVSVTFCYVVGG